MRIILCLQGKYLKHIMSGKCVQAEGFSPGVDKSLVMWERCDFESERLEIRFMKQGNIDG